MLGLKDVIHETDLVARAAGSRDARASSIHRVTPDVRAGSARDRGGRPARLPRAVVFRDSFASRLAPFLSEHFSRAVYLWQNDFDANVVLEEHPDVVIQEIVGRHLYGFLPSPELVPR